MCLLWWLCACLWGLLWMWVHLQVCVWEGRGEGLTDEKKRICRCKCASAGTDLQCVSEWFLGECELVAGPVIFIKAFVTQRNYSFTSKLESLSFSRGNVFSACSLSQYNVPEVFMSFIIILFMIFYLYSSCLCLPHSKMEKVCNTVLIYNLAEPVKILSLVLVSRLPLLAILGKPA